MSPRTRPETGAAKRLGPGYLLRMAVAAIRADPRTVRSFTGVAVAAFGLLLCFAAVNAIGGAMTRSAEQLVSGQASVFAEGYEYSMLNPQGDVVEYLEDGPRLLERLAAAPQTAAVRPRLTAGARLAAGERESGAVVLGTDFAAESYVLTAGRVPSGAGEVCLNARQQRELGLEVGDPLVLSLADAPPGNAAVEVRVACVYDNGRFGLFRSEELLMDIAGVQAILDRPGALTQVLLDVEPGTGDQEALEGLRAEFPGLVFSPAEQTAELIFSIRSAQRTVMWVLVATTGVVCASLNGSVAALALRRQRGEIAAMRAMGFGPGAVRSLYLLRTLLVGGAMIGAGSLLATTLTLLAAATGVPIGEGRQLFGEETLRPWLGPGEVALTALLMLLPLLLANLLASRPMLRRPPIELARDM